MAKDELSERAQAWLESAIAWEVCASIHRQFAKGRDAMFTTRQADYLRHANEARAKAKPREYKTRAMKSEGE